MTSSWPPQRQRLATRSCAHRFASVRTRSRSATFSGLSPSKSCGRGAGARKHHHQRVQHRALSSSARGTPRHQAIHGGMRCWRGRAPGRRGGIAAGSVDRARCPHAGRVGGSSLCGALPPMRPAPHRERTESTTISFSSSGGQRGENLGSFGHGRSVREVSAAFLRGQKLPVGSPLTGPPPSRSGGRRNASGDKVLSHFLACLKIPRKLENALGVRSCDK